MKAFAFIPMLAAVLLLKMAHGLMTGSVNLMTVAKKMTRHGKA